MADGAVHTYTVTLTQPQEIRIDELTIGFGKGGESKQNVAIDWIRIQGAVTGATTTTMTPSSTVRPTSTPTLTLTVTPSTSVTCAPPICPNLRQGCSYTQKTACSCGIVLCMMAPTIYLPPPR